MPKETLLQFDGARTASACRVCGQHFSGDARFCPFDGEPLAAAPEWDPGTDPLIGQVVDERYEIQGVLGEGGMGTVYQVRHRTLGRSLALKALRRDLAEDPELAPRFIQEAKAAARVTHPHVVQITDFGTLPHGEPYFVMELVEGMPLGRLLREAGPLGPGRCANISRQIAEALAAAHACGVIHRDLKPDNVQVVEAPTGDIVKVLDFGLAKVAGASRFTRKGMVFGTPHYMSPEQAAGDAVDHRVDIYALGVVMYELLTGRVPFEADSFMGVLSKHIYERPPPPSDAQPTGVSAELDRIVLRCLEKKPDDRYDSMEAVVAALNAIEPASTESAHPASIPRSDGQVVTLDAPSERARVPGRKRPWWLLAAAGGVCLGVIYSAARRGQEPASATPLEVESAALATNTALGQGTASTTPSAVSSPPPDAAAGAASAPEASVRPPARPMSPAPASAPPQPKPARAPRPKGSYSGGDIVNPWGE
ncbi:MAG: serine/threonine-protein kinase [Polyangiaceae bacterium]